MTVLDVRMEWAVEMESAVEVVVRALELESGVGMEWALGMETLVLALETASAVEVEAAMEMVRGTEMVWDFLKG